MTAPTAAATARAVILIRPGFVEADRQLAVTVPHVGAAGYDLVGVVPATAPQDVAELLRIADVIVVAAGDSDLRLAVEEAGGRLVEVYRSEQPRTTVRSMLATLYTGEGWAVAKLAQRFELDPRTVVDHLRRTGIARPR